MSFFVLCQLIFPALGPAYLIALLVTPRHSGTTYQSNFNVSSNFKCLSCSQVLREGWGLLQNSSALFSFFSSPPPQDACLLQSQHSTSGRGKSQKDLACPTQLESSAGKSGCVGCLNANSLSLMVFLSFFGYPSFGNLQPLFSGTNDSSLCSALLSLTSACFLMLSAGVASSCRRLPGRVPDNPSLAPF